MTEKWNSNKDWKKGQRKKRDWKMTVEKGSVEKDGKIELEDRLETWTARE